MKFGINISIVFTAVTLSVLFWAKGPDAQQKPAEHSQDQTLVVDSETAKLSPEDFAVPSAAFDKISIKTLAGGIAVKSETFIEWTNRTGKFGERVAVNDKRDLDHAIFGEKDVSGLRVCDVAYRLLQNKYGVMAPLSYRMNEKERDEIIGSLDKAMAESEEGQNKKRSSIQNNAAKRGTAPKRTGNSGATRQQPARE